MVRSRDARWFTKGVLAVALVGLAACADSPTAPLSRPLFDIWTVNPSGNPTMLWTGRSGSSAISAEATFPADAPATLTVTAYKVLDKNATPVVLSISPQGCLERIQVKAFDASGRQVWVRNVNGLNPPRRTQYTISFASGELSQAFRLHVQANVSCNDPPRTDVVEVEGTVVTSVLPDLTVPSVAISAVLGVGQVAPFSYTLRNGGATAVTPGSYRVGFFLSLDAVITTADIPVGGSAATPALGAGVTSPPLAGEVTLPAAMAAGTYYFGVIVDSGNAVPEASEVNNVGLAAGTISARLTDAAVTFLSAPTQVQAGSPFAVGAVLREMSGALPAVGVCVLRKGTVELARSSAITVAGNGNRCDFTDLVLSELGAVTLTISFEDVTPIDRDLSNNSEEATVSVLDHAVPPQPGDKFYFAANGQVYDYDVLSERDLLGEAYATLTGRRVVVDSSVNDISRGGIEQMAQFNGLIHAQLPVRIDAMFVSQGWDGAPRHSETIPGFDLSDGSSAGSMCADVPLSGYEFTLSVCSHAPDANFPYGRTTILYGREAKVVDEISVSIYWHREGSTTAPLELCNPLYVSCTQETTRSYTEALATNSLPARFGSTYFFDVQLTAGSRLYTAHVEFPLELISVDYTKPRQDTTYTMPNWASFGTVEYRSTRVVQGTRTGKVGTVPSVVVMRSEPILN